MSDRDWHTRIYVALAALVAGFLLFVGGYAVGHAGTIDPSGHTGEVYVPGVGWVLDTDHGVHTQGDG